MKFNTCMAILLGLMEDRLVATIASQMKYEELEVLSSLRLIRNSLVTASSFDFHCYMVELQLHIIVTHGQNLFLHKGIITCKQGHLYCKGYRPCAKIGSGHTKLAVLQYTANNKHPLWLRSVRQIVARYCQSTASVFHHRYSTLWFYVHEIKM